MDLFLFVFLAGILAGLLIAGLLLCAFYIFTRKRGQRPANGDIGMQGDEKIPLSSSISSMVEVIYLTTTPRKRRNQYHFSCLELDSDSSRRRRDKSRILLRPLTRKSTWMRSLWRRVQGSLRAGKPVCASLLVVGLLLRGSAKDKGCGAGTKLLL